MTRPSERRGTCVAGSGTVFIGSCGCGQFNPCPRRHTQMLYTPGLSQQRPICTGLHPAGHDPNLFCLQYKSAMQVARLHVCQQCTTCGGHRPATRCNGRAQLSTIPRAPVKTDRLTTPVSPLSSVNYLWDPIQSPLTI